MHPELLYWLAAIDLFFTATEIKSWLSDMTLIDFFHLSEKDLKRKGVTQKRITQIKKFSFAPMEKELLWCEQNNCQIITLHDESYPSLLKEIHDPPIILFVQGNVELLKEPQLAIVGTRHPSVTGFENAENFASCLTDSGLVITSGMALGIDSASHKGALKSTGKTIAVTGTGLNNIYPPSNRRLAEKIIEKGALVSEFLPNTLPKAKNFPLRNRIISGLSLGVLVVEATLNSGSLITARLAAEQGREIFAIPSSIHNTVARGCHYLIRQGAKLVETAADILEELGALLEASNLTFEEKNPSLNKDESHIFSLIGYEVTSLETIITRSRLTIAEVSSMLLSLELMGYVHSVSGGYLRSERKMFFKNGEKCSKS